MKTFEKILISGIAGTMVMTHYLKRHSTKRQENVPPVLLNKSIDQSPGLPEIHNKKSNPAGWLLHYATGAGFVAGYRVLAKRFLNHPTVMSIAAAGILNGALGVIVWKTLFKIHPSPPQNNRPIYFQHLFTAHIVFTGIALVTYKLLGKSTKAVKRRASMPDSIL